MPDDLETLDDDLAAGRIDASTYRRRRDELLAGARAAAAAPAAADPSAVPAAPVPAVSTGPVPAGSTEPAPAGPAVAAAATSPRTRPVASAGPTAPDPFPAPFRWSGGGRAPTGAAERTQAVYGSGARRQPSPPVPAHVTAPPWGRGVLPPERGEEPSGPGGSPVSRRARMQGSEVFRPPGPRPLAVLGAVLVILLSLAVLVASFLF